MRDRVRRWRLQCAVLPVCAIIALAGCDRSGQAPKPGAGGGLGETRTMAVPPPPGQPQPPPQGEPGPIEKYLFPPDLIMVHQAEIGIKDEQREEIITAVQEAQSKIMRLQWEMHQAMGQIERELESPRVDEAKALGTSGRITDIEGQIKQIHLGLLIRIKNRLSEEQQRRLTELRRVHAPHGR
ncbi:MAG: hypothetical protein AB1714_08075 [Acidobacteriota bacterium]